jgi:hypothetical protein
MYVIQYIMTTDIKILKVEDGIIKDEDGIEYLRGMDDHHHKRFDLCSYCSKMSEFPHGFYGGYSSLFLSSCYQPTNTIVCKECYPLFTRRLNVNEFKQLYKTLGSKWSELYIEFFVAPISQHLYRLALETNI